MNARRRSFLAAALLLGAACSACTRQVENSIDSRINAVLPQYFGSADTYETHVEAASSGAVLRGRVSSVTITGTNVHLRPNLLIDSMTLVAQAVEVDARHHRLESIGSASFSGTISAENLNAYLQSRQINVPDLSVSISGDRITLRGRPEALGIVKVPVSVRGTLIPSPEGDHLDFVPDRGSVSIVNVPVVVLDYLAHKVNPVIDLTHLPLPIHVDSVGVANGSLTMAGTIPPDAILKAAH